MLGFVAHPYYLNKISHIMTNNQSSKVSVQGSGWFLIVNGVSGPGIVVELWFWKVQTLTFNTDTDRHQCERRQISFLTLTVASEYNSLQVTRFWKGIPPLLLAVTIPGKAQISTQQSHVDVRGHAANPLCYAALYVNSNPIKIPPLGQ